MLDEKKHATFIGATAKISREVNGKFLIWDGAIEGKNIEIANDKKIVQKWRYADWPEGHYSIVKFKFKKNAMGTELVFTQKNIPNDKFKEIKKGWIEYYWKPLKVFLEK